MNALELDRVSVSRIEERRGWLGSAGQVITDPRTIRCPRCGDVIFGMTGCECEAAR